MSVYIIMVEVRPSNNFVVYHIEYDKELLQKHGEHLFFQDMLKSNLRMKISVFLQTMMTRNWTILLQSQNHESIFFTLSSPPL